ncbi:MAG: cysteine desulfurase family protein [Ignavibacteriales bacterium]|nr:cysteine desulfurase family protein [Ignavibacteriales bacterium]
MKVYFDNAATTPLHPKVFEKMRPFLMENFGNASSIHSFGRKARVAIEESREVIADFINANPSEIYFTSGGTEANNFVVFGIARSELAESGRNHLITSEAEHHSVYDSFLELSENGFTVNFLNIGKDSLICNELLLQNINPNSSLISLMHINNETGAVAPIEHFSSLLKQKNVFFHADSVQSFGKYKIDVKLSGIDSITASAHKINGPKGIGFAYVKSGTPLSPILFGGSQERNRRGGTENVAGIIGFAEAVRIASNSMQKNKNDVTELKQRFITGIHSIDRQGIIINGGINTSPYILSITLKSDYYKNDPEAMLMFLDINGVAVSNGAACTSGTLKPSHVILSTGYSVEDAKGTIRFSFGWQNTNEEVDYSLEVINQLTNKFKK